MNEVVEGFNASSVSCQSLVPLNRFKCGFEKTVIWCSALSICRTSLISSIDFPALQGNQAALDGKRSLDLLWIFVICHAFVKFLDQKCSNSWFVRSTTEEYWKNIFRIYVCVVLKKGCCSIIQNLRI